MQVRWYGNQKVMYLKMQPRVVCLLKKLVPGKACFALPWVENTLRTLGDQPSHYRLRSLALRRETPPHPTLVNSAFPELPREVLFPRNLSLLVPLLRHSEAAVVMEHHTCVAPAHTGIRAHGAGSV